MEKLISFGSSWLTRNVWCVRFSDVPTIDELMEFWFTKLFEL